MVNGGTTAAPVEAGTARRSRHRLALPLLAPAFSRLSVDADVVLCSSSGWAHGTRTTGRKIVYCHSPARWLYQSDRYLRTRGAFAHLTIRGLRPFLLRWDRRAAASAHRYLANSTAVRDRIRSVYGLDAEVVPPPPALAPEGPTRALEGLEPGFLLCVSRLLPYKNVDAVVRAFQGLPEERLVIVGTGPDETRLRGESGKNVTFAGSVDDEQLRWLYGSCSGVVAASHEDFGLTPLEGVAFGKPAAVLRWGGFLDTVVEGATGLFFDRPEPGAIRAAVLELTGRSWNAGELAAQADRFSEARFVERLRQIVDEERALP